MGHLCSGGVLQKYPLCVLNSRLVLLNTNRGLAHTLNGQNAAINRRLCMVCGLFSATDGHFLVMYTLPSCHGVQPRLRL